MFPFLRFAALVRAAAPLGSCAAAPRELQHRGRTPADLSLFLGTFRTVPVTRLTLGTSSAPPRLSAEDAALRGTGARPGPGPQPRHPDPRPPARQRPLQTHGAAPPPTPPLSPARLTLAFGAQPAPQREKPPFPILWGNPYSEGRQSPPSWLQSTFVKVSEAL